MEFIHYRGKQIILRQIQKATTINNKPVLPVLSRLLSNSWAQAILLPQCPKEQGQQVHTTEPSLKSTILQVKKKKKKPQIFRKALVWKYIKIDSMLLIEKKFESVVRHYTPTIMAKIKGCWHQVWSRTWNIQNSELIVGRHKMVQPPWRKGCQVSWKVNICLLLPYYPTLFTPKKWKIAMKQCLRNIPSSFITMAPNWGQSVFLGK
jgi:hypothetical protein